MVQEALVGHNGGRRREKVGAGAAEDEVAAFEGATSGVGARADRIETLNRRCGGQKGRFQ